MKEENEGFAKLIVELNSKQNMTEQNTEVVWAFISALIGQYDLDPNRVLDIVLDSFENNCESKSFLKLLAHFKRSYLPQILGFKFQSFQSDPTPTPKTLYLLAGTLIKHALITWEELYPHVRDILYITILYLFSSSLLQMEKQSTILKRI